MRERVSDWRRVWIAANGRTNELEVIINDGANEFSPALYVGSFLEIPVYLLPLKVIEFGKIVSSTVPERVGAYMLTVVCQLVDD